MPVQSRLSATSALGTILLICAAAGCSTSTCNEQEKESVDLPAVANWKYQQTQNQQRALQRRKQMLKRGGVGGLRLSVSHIVVSYKGAAKAPPGVTRSREEAATRAREAYDKIIQGTDFAEVAGNYSDGPFRSAGGAMGVFPAARVPKPILKKILSVPIGEVSQPYETAFGYHIIKRNPVEMPNLPGGANQGMSNLPGDAMRPATMGGDQIHVRHISVYFKSPLKKAVLIKRNKEEAKRVIDEVASKLDKQGNNFSQLAAEYSDGPGQYKGGDIGRLGRGRVPKVLEDAAYALKVNEISGVVESNFGYHIVQRLP